MRKMGSSAVRAQLEDGLMGASSLLSFPGVSSFGLVFVGVDFFLVFFSPGVGGSFTGVAFLGVAFRAISPVTRSAGVGWLCCVRFEGRE
jgi:hypothetical protein